MTKNRLSATLFAVFMASCPALTSAQEVPAAPFTLPLYSGEPAGGVPLTAEPESLFEKPGDPIVRVDHVREPDMKVFLPPVDKRNGAAVVIYPGGGYSILAIDHEGYQIAKLLNEWGVAGIVVKYRVSKVKPGLYKHPIPLLDARQGLRLTRQNAEKWGIDPNKVGVMGFSAGGHLASCMATLGNTQLPGEDAAAFAARTHVPNFAALIYAVVGMGEKHGHSGSQDNLLGKAATPDTVTLMNTAKQVSKDTPPTFLVSTHGDKAVPPMNSLLFYQAMQEHSVPGELHIWEKGGHGYGILPNKTDVTKEWPVRFHRWLAERGWANLAP